jgi:hypothetical protein
MREGRRNRGIDNNKSKIGRRKK